MKRELILDEVKYDGEYYSTKILKQTHRCKEFTPTGWRWKHNGFALASDNVPEFNPVSFCVGGDIKNEDNRIIRTKDKSVIDKALAAVKAYNEEFGCDENLETARKNFIEAEGKTSDDISKMLGRMENCSREEFMELKRSVYLKHANLNLREDCCVYCLDARSSLGGLECNECEYGRGHGNCGMLNSVYGVIVTAKLKLEDELENY